MSARLRHFRACSEQARKGASAYAPNKMAREPALLKQLSPKSRFGVTAPPHPKAGYHRMKNLKSKTSTVSMSQTALNQWTWINQKGSCSPFPLLRWEGLGQCPESHLSARAV